MTLKWTKKQRSLLTAIRVPHKNDPTDFFPTAAQAWAATGLDGDAAGAADLANATTQWKGCNGSPALFAYWVETHGLVAACKLVRGFADGSDWGVSPTWFLPFRRHLLRADRVAVSEARNALLHGVEFTQYKDRQNIAFLFDDKELALSLVDDAAGEPLQLVTLHLSLLPTDAALKVIASSTGAMSSYRALFDTVESLGAEAAPVFEAVLARAWNGMAPNRKLVEQAWQLALSGGAAAAPAKAPKVAAFVGWTATDATEERFTKDATVVISGSFPGFTSRLIEQRLRARGIRTRTGFGTKKNNTHALFAGEGATKNLLDDAAKRGISVLGPTELSALLATPLFRYRERFEQMVREALSTAATEVRQWYIGPPATEEELTQSEKTMGVPLDPALRSLYSQCNGVALYAECVPPNADYKEQRLEPVDHSGEWHNPAATDRLGMAIPKLTALRSWAVEDKLLAVSDATMRVGKRSMKASAFAARGYWLDFWHHYHPIVVVLGDAGCGRVVYADDHGADFGTGEEASVEDYFEDAIRAQLMTRTIGKHCLAIHFTPPAKPVEPEGPERIVVFTLDDVPSLKAQLPPEATAHGCLFFVARQGSPTLSRMWKDIPEPLATHVSETNVLCQTIVDKENAKLRTVLYSEGGPTSYDGGFHAGDAAGVREYLASRCRLIPLADLVAPPK